MCTKKSFVVPVLVALLKRQSLLLFGWLLLASPLALQAQFNYTVTNGTITITRYTGSGGVVVIPDTINGLPVRVIGNQAFSYCTRLTSVTISSGVTNIEALAFAYCTSLTNVIIPSSITSIGVDAFYFCTSLASVTISSGVTNIREDAFAYCTSLANITIPNSVTGIGGEAFYFCTSLTSVTISSAVTNIGRDTFAFCSSLTSITIPNSVTGIGLEAFSYCTRLTNVTISSGVTDIGEDAFYWCTNLTSITIPNSVTGIGLEAFAECFSLTNITLGNGVTSIGDLAFGQCTKLTSVYFQGNTPSLGGTNVFYGDALTIYYLPGTTGWSTIFGGAPTALWTLPFPLILNNTSAFGVQSNQFGFTVSWATNLSVVVEASPTLSNPSWSPLITNNLVGGSFYFSDPQWTKYPSRFYRVRSP